MGRRRTGRGENNQAQLVGDALSALQVGLLVLDPADTPVLANPAAYALGLVRDATRAVGAAGQVHAVIRTLAGQVRRGGLSREVELDLPRTGTANLDTEVLGVQVRVVPLTGAGYAPGHVTVQASDVTESRRLARVRRDFVANVSHELKTPVGALQLLSETLLDAVDDPEASRRFAERIHHESSRLGRLVGDLLELSRLQGAEPLPALNPVAVDRIVAEVIDRSRTAAAAKKITIEYAGMRGQTVYGSERQLVTAIANLVENAIAYSPDETVVGVRVDRVDDVMEVAVTDQGVGISVKDQERIFERFYRADHARSRETGGTGLGLAIVKHIAVNHGGRVAVVSAPGKGSTFTFRLPARPPEAVLPLPPGIAIDFDVAEAASPADRSPA
ncbi:ATP-binding protein [Luedemannella flava]|uniref:Sensor-like histidine kinase SenX3 n=1 Tax=Luedemannella flava TaxID=349316 RepID=A0ABN2M7L0_9ACTN